MKLKTVYRCSSCGHVASKWMGKCPQCNTWDSFIEEIQEHTKSSSKSAGRARQIAVDVDTQILAEVETSHVDRISTGMAELDRVLGGGVVPGSVVLVGGDPGMGKSTLTLQTAAVIGTAERHALYVTGEESLHQIKQRGQRLDLDLNFVKGMAETSVERIVNVISSAKPSVVIIDSVQTMVTDLLESSAGSVAQVRECTALLTRTAKGEGIPVVLIGHVTKDGFLAGPKILEHMVDAVLQFEGEGRYSYRIIRALKNRYGSTNEIGVFDMTESGLREVPNPSEVLLANRITDEPGTAIAAVIEGTRPLLIEVQALVSNSGYSVPQRVSTGYDTKRLQMILAVLERRCGISVRQSDVFVNVAGGISIQDAALDLSVAVAIASSVKDVPAPLNTAFVGEIGLTGEVRQVGFLEQRIAEAERIGVFNLYIPQSERLPQKPSVRHVRRLLHVLTDIFVSDANG